MRPSLLLLLLTTLPAAAQQPTQLTIYNQDFAMARTTVPLDLRAGTTEVLTTAVTSQLEPDSVVLRDPSGRTPIHILEQSYDAGVVTQAWLLEKYEGKTLDFQIYGPHTFESQTGESRLMPATTITGRIIRAGDQPLIEVNGHLQFQLPGTPIFRAGTDGLILKPTLRWQIESPQPAHLTAELDYITRGMSWQATYNVVIPEAKDTKTSDLADILGWVTIQNNSGTDFPQAAIQLMAGDVAKIQDMRARGGPMNAPMNAMAQNVAVEVTQKNFDDFHLYDLHRTVSLRNKETKQVQFLEAANVAVQRTYQADSFTGYFQPFYPGYHNDQPAYNASPKVPVSIRQEIKNSTANHLGLPLPAGRLRIYRRDTDGQTQFVGEGNIPHTPAEQPIQIVSGNAFDLTVTRRQTAFHVDQNNHVITESFELKLDNQKPQPATIHAVEHMNRAQNFEITDKSAPYTQRDSNTLDFPITVPAKSSSTLTYNVRYTW